MRCARICCVFFLLLCGLPQTAAAAQSDTVPMSPAALQTVRGQALQTGQGQPLQGGSPASGMPAATAQQQMLPSGQGRNLPQGQQPTPLYVPGTPWLGDRPFTAIPAWAQRVSPSGQALFPPFGANLFQGYFAGTYSEGVNPDYVIMPGDRILIHIWGAHMYSDTLMVDQQGNIFLPEVGPVRVAGVRNGQLQGHIRNNLASTFRSNIQIYANLLTAQPVAVYVTGFVNRPGRYAGGMNDSVLYYLDRAGGIIPERGSYRDIFVQRHGRTVARTDLYAFILTGKLPGGALRDGDVIVVGPKGDSVIAGGLIPQQAAYEGSGTVLNGAELIRMAAPLPAASHVSVTGSRDSTPFHVYLSLREFGRFALAQGDWVEFLADKPGETIMVSITGSTLGATRYPVKRATTLRGLLAHVSVDAELANLSGIYLKRRTVVEQQRKAIADALYRLEHSVLTTTSNTAEEASIRVREAELVQNFVQRAANVQPDGVVVVTRAGRTSDIILEDGDEIVIPQKSDIVQVAGEVMIPKALVYGDKLGVKDYVAGAGGFTDRADAKNILVVHPNGEIQLVRATKVLPGDLLLVLPRYDVKGLQIFKDLVQVLYQIAIATRVVLTI